MRVCHGVNAAFDGPNLVSCLGLAPVPELAEQAGLHDLVRSTSTSIVRVDRTRS